MQTVLEDPIKSEEFKLLNKIMTKRFGRKWFTKEDDELKIVIECKSLIRNENMKLDSYEKKVFSQFGEDGITEYIFDKIGTDSKYFVEIGTQDGNECNTRFLLEEKGWTGIMLDAIAPSNPSINLHNHFITRHNIEEVWDLYNIPRDFDYFSIDTDGVDWHLLRRVLNHCNFKAFVCEYNACLGSHVDQVLDYSEGFDDFELCKQWDAGEYNIFYGASLIAYQNLAKEYGFSLVYTNGVNAFFVNDKYWTNEEDFPDTNNTEALFKDFPLDYRYVYEHPTHKTDNFNTSKLLLKLPL